MAAPQLPASHRPIGEAPPAPPARPRVVAVGTALVSAATLLFFIGALGVYLQIRAKTLAAGGLWVPEEAVVPLQQPNVILLALIMGSVTVQWAVDAIRRNDRPQAFVALGLTEVFGFATLNMAGYLFSVMKLDASSGAMAVMTYAITGAFVATLVVAMIFIALMAFRALGGQLTGRQNDGVSAAAMFWHVQVVAFALIWYAIYITK